MSSKNPLNHSLLRLFKQLVLGAHADSQHPWQFFYESTLVLLCFFIGKPNELSWKLGSCLLLISAFLLALNIFYRQIFARFLQFPNEWCDFLIVVGLSVMCREPFFFTGAVASYLILLILRMGPSRSKGLRHDPAYAQRSYLISMFFPKVWPGQSLSFDNRIDKTPLLRRLGLLAFASGIMYSRLVWDHRWEFKVLIGVLTLWIVFWALLKVMRAPE